MPRPWPELARLLRDSGERYGAPESSLSRLEALSEGRAVMVVTGQQTGFLGGPLYTFLKAYHTTRLAADLETALGIPVIPVFWLEGEDHDLEEVRTANFLNKSGELQSLRFEPEQEIPNFEVGRYAVQAESQLVELFANLDLPNEQGTELLREAYTDRSLSDAMGRLLAKTLGPRGLLVIEGMDPDLKRMALPLWENVLERAADLGSMLSHRGEQLRADGYAVPLTPTPDSFLFYLTGADHVRASLTYTGKIQYPDGRTVTIPGSKLRDILDSGQWTISPKAALRPLYQDFVLPTIAYVAGPGELDYHAQLAPFYRELNVAAPSLFPRLSATLLDSRAVKVMEKLDLSIERLLTEDKHSLIKDLIREADDGKTAALFDSARAGTEELYARIKREVANIDPTLEGAAHGMTGKALHLLNELQQKSERALKQKHSTALAKLEKILAAVKPGGKPAERVLCTGYYLAKFGPDKLLAALDELPVDGTSHKIILMDALPVSTLEP